jgi:hypothetical protein
MGAMGVRIIERSTFYFIPSILLYPKDPLPASLSRSSSRCTQLLDHLGSALSISMREIDRSAPLWLADPFFPPRFSILMTHLRFRASICRDRTLWPYDSAVLACGTSALRYGHLNRSHSDCIRPRTERWNTSWGSETPYRTRSISGGGLPGGRLGCMVTCRRGMPR